MAKLTPARALILETLAAEIEAVKASQAQLDQLIGRYTAEQGLKITFSEGTNRARMRGVVASNTASARGALLNWANAARRALLNGAG
jgi:hypothetical protein